MKLISQILKFNTKILTLALFIYTSLSVSNAWSFEGITWEGHYRAEALYLVKPDLGQGKDKSYATTHLVLNPSMQLYDRLTLKTTWDLFNSGDGLSDANQFGSYFGSKGSNNIANYSSLVFADRQIHRSRDISLRNFYLTMKHSGSELRVGRAPLHFGLGMLLNSGEGIFDHYYDNRDLVQYSADLGPFKFIPHIARLSSELGLSSEEVIELGIQFYFLPPDSGLELGILALNKSIDASLVNLPGITSSDAKVTNWNFFAKRTRKKYNYAVEFGINDGDFGNSVDYKGFGALGQAEVELKSWLNLGIVSGFASGNDASETSKYSAYAFDQNINVGMIMMNHPLGNTALDLTGTNIYEKTAKLGTAYEPHKVPDTDRASNVMFISPKVDFIVNDKWTINTQFVYARLLEANVFTSGSAVDKELGYEFDFGFEYKPRKKIFLKSQLGVFVPGKAFEDNGNFDSETIFGFQTQLGIKL